MELIDSHIFEAFHIHTAIVLQTVVPASTFTCSKRLIFQFWWGVQVALGGKSQLGHLTQSHVYGKLGGVAGEGCQMMEKANASPSSKSYHHSISK